MRKRSSNNRKPTCSKCGFIKEENRRRYGYCLSCHNAFMRATRPAYIDLSEEQKKKATARSMVRVNVQRGKIKKADHCFIEDCSNTDLEAHHQDYSKPLDVIWLCQHHHRALTNLY